MTIDDAVKDVKFWLDEAGVYFSPAKTKVALRRALLAYLNASAIDFETSAEARTRLIQLTPPPATGTGPAGYLPFLSVLRITAVTLWFGTDPEGVGASPISRQAVAMAKRSYFKRPTNRVPRYTEERNGVRRMITFLAGEEPARWAIHYLAMPVDLRTASGDTLIPLPETDAQVVVQQAVRMLMAQRQQDYAAQAQLESKVTA